MKIIILLAAFILISCQETIVTPEEKLFDPQDLPLLGLEDLENFWGDNKVYNTNEFDDYPNYQLDENKSWDDSKIGYSDYAWGHFFPKYLDGVSLDDNNIKEISVSVFASQAAAIKYMEFLGGDRPEGPVGPSFTPEKGDPNKFFNGRFWLYYGFPKYCPLTNLNYTTIWVNNKNTIIFVEYRNNYIGDIIKNNQMTINTALEIIRRIDFLSK